MPAPPARPRARSRLLLAILASAAAVSAAAAAKLGVGSVIEVLQVGDTTYRRAEVRAVEPRSIVIAYPGGLASIPWRELSPDLQAAFGYDPRIEETAGGPAPPPPAVPARPSAGGTGARGRPAPSAMELLQRSFGQAPVLKARVDLRPEFFSLGLEAKNQGPRPSCAVFALVSALELQNARLTGRPEHFSEQYLVWATAKLLHRAPRLPAADPAGPADGPAPAPDPDEADEGFTLEEVVAALRVYGIPSQASLPYRFSGAGADPPPDVIAQARRQRLVTVLALPGPDRAAQLANLVQALDAGFPVAIGLQWPSFRALRTAYLSAQQPRADGGHAVAIVGYENRTGALPDTVFIFKNSWGVKWGAAGYGFVTYAYLERCLLASALLEVAPAAQASPR